MIAAHPTDYEPAGDWLNIKISLIAPLLVYQKQDWQANAVHALQKLVPPAQRGMLDQLFVPRSQGDGLMMGDTDAADRQLGEL